MQEIRKIKKHWYMAKWKEKQVESKIQMIVDYQRTYLFLVSDWLTEKEIKNINLDEWNFMTFTSWEQQKAGVTDDSNN